VGANVELPSFLYYNQHAGFIGIPAILGVAYFFSTHRHKIQLKMIGTALAMQVTLAFFILKTTIGIKIFKCLSEGFSQLYLYADEGCKFVFGGLADAKSAWGFVFAVKVLPIIIFFGALMSLLFHLGIIQKIVKVLAYFIRPLLGTSGAETLAAVANSALGQTEAPLLIKNYLSKMTRSEMITVMISGFASLSGAILAIYGLMGVPIVHLLAASFISVPGSLLIAKMLIPETEKPETMGGKVADMKPDTTNMLDAIAAGTSDGLMLALNVAAMLIAFISLIALFNALLSFITLGHVTLDTIFGYLFAGVAYLISIPLQECGIAGKILGQKLVVNEFVAYSTMLKESLSDRSVAILTYALAGFANFSCIGIQVGGIGALCPDKRKMLTQLGMRALLGGTLVNLLNAAVASLFI